jgi:K+ transporter
MKMFTATIPPTSEMPCQKSGKSAELERCVASTQTHRRARHSRHMACRCRAFLRVGFFRCQADKSLPRQTGQLAAMERNAMHVSDFFKLPRDSLVEIGRHIAI